MSLVSIKFNILFCIIFVQYWKIISPAAVFYNDYSRHDIFGADANDFFDYNLPKTRIDHKEYLSDANENKVNIARQDTVTAIASIPPLCEKQPETTCYPVTPPTKVKQPKTTCFPVTTTSKAKEPAITYVSVTPPSKSQATTIVEHILRTIKSMRTHATALITDMNTLERDLSGSSPTNLDTIKNSFPFSGEKILYPDVLYQSPGYIINEWSVPVIKDVPQTNEFVEEAQEAVKSWKQQIENCKRILDNAVHNALRTANIKSDIIIDPLQNHTPQSVHSQTNSMQITNSKENRNLTEEDKEDLQKLAFNKKHKQYGLYDALDNKFVNY